MKTTVQKLSVNQLRPAGEVRPDLLKQRELDTKAFMKDPIVPQSDFQLPSVKLNHRLSQLQPAPDSINKSLETINKTDQNLIEISAKDAATIVAKDRKKLADILTA